MRPKTSTNRGAVELPLTYLYAVLIGIVVFIVATRVIGVQGQSADETNTQLVLEAFDRLISGAAQNPNVIQQVQAPRDGLALAWDGQSRIRIGSRTSPLSVPVFSEERLGQPLSAWTYPYRVETASSPLLYLSDGTITYRIVNLSEEAFDPRQDITREAPANAHLYGLDLIGASTASVDPNHRDLCIHEDEDTWAGCELRLRSQEAPYGYLSWPGSDTWYPIVSYGQIFAALFAAGEDEWNDAITTPEARDRINRNVLIQRAELFENNGDFRDECKDIYEASGENLIDIKNTIRDLEQKDDPTEIDLDVFEPIPDAIANLRELDRQLTRYDCPPVIR